MNAISDAIDVAFNDDNIAVNGLYKVGGSGAGITVRVIKKNPDADSGLFQTGAVVSVESADVRVSEVSTAAEGDTLTIDSIAYVVVKPEIDARGLRWKLALDYP